MLTRALRPLPGQSSGYADGAVQEGEMEILAPKHFLSHS